MFKHTLPNGLRVVGERMPHSRSVSLGIWVGVGSVDETVRENGISHFVEHMVFKGTEKRSAVDIASEIEGVGGQLNAFTSKECTCYYVHLLDEHLELGMDLLGDMVFGSVMDTGELNKERGVVLEEIAMVEDSPEEVAHNLLSETYFRGHPLGRQILGTSENLRRFTREDLLMYMRRHYGAENIVVSAAGNFEEQRLLDLVNAHITEKAQKGADRREAPEFSAGRTMNFREKDTEQNHLCIAMPGAVFDSADSYPLMIMNNILGGAMSSRLFQRIREQRGLAYSVYSYPSSYSNNGMFSIYAGTKPENAQSVFELIAEELKSFKADGVTKEEFTRSREQLRGNYVLSQEGPGGRMNALGKSTLLRDHIYTESEILDKIANVTQDQVYEIIQKVVDFDCMVVAYVGKEVNIDMSLLR